TERCIGAAKLDAVLLDDGYLPEQSQPIDWHQRFVPTRRLLRLEKLAEDLVRASHDFDDFRDQFRAALESADVVGFKSIAAYRCGLKGAAKARKENVLAAARSLFGGWQLAARQ